MIDVFFWDFDIHHFTSNKKQSLKIWKESGLLSSEEELFLQRIGQRSGLGEENTYLPKSINPLHCGANPSLGELTHMNKLDDVHEQSLQIMGVTDS